MTTTLDRTLLALAHPTRRAILERIMCGETRITELAEPFAISLNAVSKHVRILERARLVQRRRAWREHLVSFSPAPLKEASEWIEKTRAFWSAQLEALDKLLKAEDAAACERINPGKNAMTAEAPGTLQVTRRFDASMERVFDAWLDPERAGKWLFATPTGKMVRVEIDGRVGGSFNFTRREGGDDVEHVGTYLEIDRPRRLVFAFGVPKYSSQMTRVSIDLKPLPAGCELTLTHEGVPAEWRERTREGWANILEALGAQVA